MKKVIRMKDLDVVKQEKKMDKMVDETFKRNCLICNQVMEFIGDLVWYCKRCDSLTAVSNLISIRDTNRDNEFGRVIIEKS